MNSDLDAQTRLIVEQLFHCGKAGDIDGVFALLDDNVVVHEPPFLVYAGSYKGRDNFLTLFALIIEKYFDDDKMEIDYIATNGNHAIVMASAPGKRGETVTLAEEIRVRNGKVVEIRIYMHQPPLTAWIGP